MADSLAFFKPGVKRLFFLREPFRAATGQVPSERTISVPMFEPAAGSGKRLLSPSHGSAPWASVRECHQSR